MSDENPLMDRFEEHKPQSSQEGEKSSTSDTAPTDDTDNPDNTEDIGSDETSSGQSEQESQTPSGSVSSDTDTRRSRPHTAIYISEDLVEKVDERYRKINGQLMIEGNKEIEKHKHFFEGLIKAGLDHDELEEIVLSQRER